MTRRGFLAAAVAAKEVRINAPYVPTAPEVVDAMLRMARISPSDVVYDLGSGDGRIVIAAAKQYGARAVGIELDPEKVLESRRLAQEAGVAGRVRFETGDIFEADIREATVVTLYLLPGVLAELRDKLVRDLAPGTRIVSHSFRMGSWEPEVKIRLRKNLDVLYLWRVPGKR